MVSVANFERSEDLEECLPTTAVSSPSLRSKIGSDWAGRLILKGLPRKPDIQHQRRKILLQQLRFASRDERASSIPEKNAKEIGTTWGYILSWSNTASLLHF